jgi:hypothetical protein
MNFTLAKTTIADIYKRNSKNLTVYFLLAIIIGASFFYCFRLRDTFVMAGDTSRDLMRLIEIWQNKEITMIGPPVNTISNNPIKVYFGSMYYYLGLFGLLISHFDPVGSVYINIVVTLISIPFLYLLSKKILRKQNLAFLVTFIYTFSPITIALGRSYWNPNLVVPLSVFIWFFLLYKKSYINYFIGGVILGIIFNLHFMNSIPVLFYLFLLLFNKDRKYLAFISIGFILTLAPFIAFEIKNHFFLIKAFVNSMGGFSTFSHRTLNPFLSIDSFSYIFGLGTSQYFFTELFNVPFNVRIIINSLVGIIFIYFLIKNRKILDGDITKVVLCSLFMSWYFQQWNIIGLRYILSAFPLLIMYCILFVSSLNKYLILLLILPMSVLSIQLITHELNPHSITDYYPVTKIEEISRAIVADKPEGAYNLTENLQGDSRSLAYRYFVTRDANIKPQPVENYNTIDTLYIITPSISETYKKIRGNSELQDLKKLFG